MTKQEKTDVKQSKKVSEDFLGDPESQTKAREDAKKKNKEERKSSLKDLIKCKKRGK